MRKFFIILALVALVMLPVMAGSFAIGLEAGMPAGVTVDYQVSDKTDIYTTAAFGYVGKTYIDTVVGIQRKVANFSIKSATFDVLAGIQAGMLFYVGDYKGADLVARLTGTVAYNWNKFTAYLRGGIGGRLELTNEAKIGLSWSAALGCTYHL